MIIKWRNHQFSSVFLSVLPCPLFIIQYDLLLFLSWNPFIMFSDTAFLNLIFFLNLSSKSIWFLRVYILTLLVLYFLFWNKFSYAFYFKNMAFIAQRNSGSHMLKMVEIFQPRFQNFYEADSLPILHSLLGFTWARNKHLFC